MKIVQPTPVKVGIRELKQRLSYYVRRAEGGHPIQITKHGRVILTVNPIFPHTKMNDPELEISLSNLERQGLLRRGTGEPIGLHPRITLGGKSLSQTIIEDRR